MQLDTGRFTPRTAAKNIEDIVPGDLFQISFNQFEPVAIMTLPDITGGRVLFTF
jgi:hypothetical protein